MFISTLLVKSSTAVDTVDVWRFSLGTGNNCDVCVLYLPEITTPMGDSFLKDCREFTVSKEY